MCVVVCCECGECVCGVCVCVCVYKCGVLSVWVCVLFGVCV